MIAPPKYVYLKEVFYMFAFLKAKHKVITWRGETVKIYLVFFN